MRNCLVEKSLWSLHEGEGSAGDRAHLDECLNCTRRYRQLTDDLKEIVAVLKQPPPARVAQTWMARSALRWSLAAAVVVFAFLLGRMTTAEDRSDSIAMNQAGTQIAATDYAAASYGLYIDTLIHPQDEQDPGQLAFEDPWANDSDGF